MAERFAAMLWGNTKGGLTRATAKSLLPVNKTGWVPDVQTQGVFTLQVTDDPTYRWVEIIPYSSEDFINYYVEGEHVIINEDPTSRFYIATDFGSRLQRYYVMMDEDGSFFSSLTPWEEDYNAKAMCMCLVYDHTAGRFIYRGWEFHSWAMNPVTRKQLHDAGSPRYVSGLAITVNGSSSYQVDITDGTIADEDIEADIYHDETGYGEHPFEQPLRPWKGPKLWYDGTDWNDDIAQIEEVVVFTGGNVCYNPVGGGLTQLGVGEYTVAWCIATMDWEYPMMMVVGTGKGSTAEAAIAANDEPAFRAAVAQGDFPPNEYLLRGIIAVKNLGSGAYTIEEIPAYTPETEFDKYVETMTFDEATRTLTLTRSANLEDLTAVILGTTSVDSQYSITGDGSTGDPIQLDGDTETPDPEQYYGTDGDGTRGWHDLPDDNYVDGVTFDETSREMTITRTGTLEDLTVEIPCCDFPDIVGSSQEITNGYLYNGYVALDTRNIAPSGWHVPTYADMQVLDATIKSYGGKLKDTSSDYWDSPNTGASDQYGFSARGGGWRVQTGIYIQIRQYGYWWCGDYEEGNPTYPYSFTLQYNDYDIDYAPSSIVNAFSIRLLKDDSEDTGTMTGNDGKIYPTVKIGDQVWTAVNLMETKFRTGDTVDGPVQDNAEWAALTSSAYCTYDNDEDNASSGSYVIMHNLTEGKQGGDASADEFYHHTADEIDQHVYEAPEDGTYYVRKDGEWVEVPTVGGADAFTDLTDAPSSYVDQGGKVLKVNSGETGIEFADAGASADEKLKYDSGDTAAGYLSEKVVAGTGISLAEGTGGDADKLEITCTVSDTNDYVDSAAYTAESTGTPPTVTNTNNVVKLTLGRTGALADLTAELGSMAAMKFWTGTQAEYDALGSWATDTLYYITET
jgi:uncharacterized protein (TIGR02145 family)